MNRKRDTSGPVLMAPVLILLVFCLLFGCQRLPSNEKPALGPKTKDTADTARYYLKFSTGWMEATDENCAGF